MSVFYSGHRVPIGVVEYSKVIDRAARLRHKHTGGLSPVGDDLNDMQQWRMYIRGKPQREVNRALLLQAVIALGKQLQQEAQDTISPETPPPRKP